MALLRGFPDIAQPPCFEIPSTNYKKPMPKTDKMYRIFFLLQGEDISQATVAKVLGGECISDLQQEIRSLWKMSKLADLNPIYIGLYKAPIAHTSNDIDSTLQGFYLQLDRNEHQGLKPITKIKDAFPEHSAMEFIVVVVKPLGELLLKLQPSLLLNLVACHLPACLQILICCL